MNGFYDAVENRKACCHIRKVEPLGRLLAGAPDGSPACAPINRRRAPRSPMIEYDAAHGLIKLNPLLDYTRDAIVARPRNSTCPVNELHAKGYLSSAARPARAPSSPAKTSAPAAGGGKKTRKRNAGCMSARMARHGGPTPKGPALHDGVGPSRLGHLDRLEAESIHIMREVVAECERPVMLYSIGKDCAGDAASRA